MSSFHNRARAAQLVDFAGLKFGKCSPTDIDLSLDFAGKTFIFTELKGKHQSLTVGQKLHLQFIVDGLKLGGKTAFAVFAKHDTSAKEDVIAADCFDVLVYDGYNWTPSYKSLGDTLEDLYQGHLAEYGK